MRKPLLICLIMPFILSLFSCDEFLLKKTVAVLSISGDIRFDPTIPQVSGSIQYNIKNNQEADLKEVYLICHPQVELLQVIYDNKKMSFETGQGMGDKIFRVKIPSLSPGTGAHLSLKFRVQGSFQEDRFLLSKERVFFDVKQIWLPVPFADHFEFPYTLEVRCPSSFYPVLGAKKEQEKLEDDVRITLWKSELNNALMTGTLQFLPFERYQEKNIYYYSATTNNIDRIMDYIDFTQKRFKHNMGYLPVSEFHVINQMYPYAEMKEVIDGEYLGNAIMLENSLCDYDSYSSSKDLLNSTIPFVPNTSEIKILEVIAHEIAHNYISTLVRFEDDFHLNMEALTEFIAIDIMRQYHEKFLDLMNEKNRILLINLFLQKKNRTPLWKYLYLVNTLEAAFWQNNRWTSHYLSLLIDKYRFSEIQWRHLSTTIDDINRILSKNTNNILLDTEVMENWKDMRLHNFSLSSVDILLTNMQAPKWNRIQKMKQVQIKSHFPYSTDSILISYTPTNIYSNHIFLENNSTTNILLSMDTITTKLDSRYTYLETHLADNQINFKDRSWQDLVNEINHFYKGENYNTRFISVGQDVEGPVIRTADAHWNNLYQDRDKSQSISPNVFFQYDQVYFSKKEFYLEAYKWINNKAFSYVIFKGKIIKNRLHIEAILDPTI